MEKVKRKRFGRRILSVVLAVALMVGLMPEIPGTVLTAHAAEAGAFTVEGGTAGTDYTYADGVLTIKTATPMTIKNSNPEIATTDRIVVARDVSANITLAGVNIDVSSEYNTCAFRIEDGSTGNVTITLADDSTNILMSGERCAGLQKDGTTGTLIICGGAKGNGSLKATGGNYGAGIGGGYGLQIGFGVGKNITISGGTVTATGGGSGAGIGGGYYGDGTGITISGGTVTANGRSGGAGIGGGDYGSGSDIAIEGGIVTATGGSMGAGIGGGYGLQTGFGVGKNITINGGSVKVTAGSYANAIGGGRYNVAVTPTLADGTTPVYLFTVQNANSEAIKINEKDYPKAHGEEKAIYAYLPVTGEFTTVQVGAVSTKYGYDTESAKWLKVIDVPKKDTNEYVYEVNPKNYQIAASADYTISDNTTQTDAGTYTVTVTRKDAENTMWSDGTTGVKEFTFVIQEADSAVASAPEAKSDLVYNGSEHKLISGGSAVNGTMQYSLQEDGTYSETLPVGTDAGDYTVYYKVVGATNYSDTAVQSITASIAQAALDLGEVTGTELVLTGEPTGVNDLVQSIQCTNDTIAGTFEITDAELVYGTHTYNWKFTPTDGNYKAVTGTVTIKVTKEPQKENDVYLISNLGEFLWFVEQVNEGQTSINGKLTADIDLNGIDWTIIDSFAGTFDGNNHVINGLNKSKDLWNGDTTKIHGFIRTLSESGIIRNLTFSGAKVFNHEGDGCISAVIAYTNNGTIENCMVTDSTIHKGAYTILGVVAGVNNGTIKNCASISNTIRRRYSNNSAVCGFVWQNSTGAKIDNCYTYECTYEGTVTEGVLVNACYAFTQSNTGTITNCYYYESTEVLSDVCSENSIVSATEGQFASGEVTYLLNGSTSTGDLVWGQTLGTDNYPVFMTENNLVCKSPTEETYSNHNQFNEDGFCVNCSDYEKPEIIDGVYQIANAGQLVWFAEYVNSGNQSADAKLVADIDMKNISWTTICETALYYKEYGTGCDYGYSGTFDGNGHAISNLTATSSADGAASVGLFGTVSGTIKNLGMKNFTLKDSGKDMRAGAIVGQLLTANGKVSNCYVIGATIETEDNVAGGIAGCVYEGTVENCYVVDATISGADGRFGYVTGDVCADGGSGNGSDRPGIVKNCFTNEAKISSDRKGTDSVVGGEAEVSAERFASGEVAYLLNGSASTGNLAWYQNLGESADAYPIPDNTHGKVYSICKCDGKTFAGYSNVNENEAHEPKEDDGDCTTEILCSKCEAVHTEAKESHTDESGDGKCDNCETILIGNITITDIDAPISEKNFDTKAVSTTAGLSEAELTIAWTKGSEPAGETADYATTYTAKITLARANGAVFWKEVTATVNGEAATVTLNDDGTVTVTYDFTTATRKIISVQAPAAPEEFSSAYTADTVLTSQELGNTAKVTLEGSLEPVTVNMAVEWTLENAENAEYAPGIFDKNTFRWTVKAGEYEGFDVNDVSLTGTVTIENAYILEPVTTSIPVRVYLQVPEGYEGTYNSEETYKICLEQKTEAPMPVGTPDKYVTADAGEVDFGEITFKEPGTYKYKVELQGEVSDVKKDEESSREVTIEVTDNGDGTMSVSCNYTEESPLTFTNVLCIPEAATAVINATVSLEGKTLEAGQFSFELLDSDRNVIQTVNNDAQGNITFDPISYAEGATGKDFTYYVRMVNGGEPEYTYDETERTITVSVTDDGLGGLTTEVRGEAAFVSTFEHVDKNDDGYCDACGEKADGISALAGHSVSLGDNIGMKFYMELDSSVLNDSTAYMQFTLPGKNPVQVKVSSVGSPVTKDGKTCYVFTCEVAAKEMADTITAQLFCNNGTVQSTAYEYSVKQYAEALIKSSANEKEVALANAMLNYGAYAQTYFGHNTGYLANVNCPNKDLTCDLSYASTVKPKITDNSVVLDYEGSTLILESEIKVRHYFKVADGQTYSGNLSKYVPKSGDTVKGDYYYYESEGIPASMLKNCSTDTESVPGFEIYYCPMSYVITVIATNDESDLNADTGLQNLMKALYLYSEAVSAYKGGNAE